MDGAQPQPNNLVAVNVNEAAAKAKSHAEVSIHMLLLIVSVVLQWYQFVKFDLKAAVDEPKHVTIYHMDELKRMPEKRIKINDFKTYEPKEIEGLAIKDILVWARQYPEVMIKLPSHERDIQRCLRKFVTSVCYTIKG